MVEPEQADVAFGLAWQACRAFKVSEDGGAVVLFAATLVAEKTREKSVAPRRIHQKPGLPLVNPSVFVTRGNERARLTKLDAGHAAAFDRGRALARGMSKQDVV